MKQITVYRYEDDRGRGMYTGRISVPQALYRYDVCPDPLHDNELLSAFSSKDFGSLNELKQHDVFGFRSLKQLRRWMQSEELHTRITRHYNLIKYKVPESKVAVGRTQVVFDRRHVTNFHLVTGLKF